MWANEHGGNAARIRGHGAAGRSGLCGCGRLGAAREGSNDVNRIRAEFSGKNVQKLLNIIVVMLNFEFQGDFRMIFGSVRRFDSLSRQLRLPSTFGGVFRSLFDCSLRLGALKRPSRCRCDSASRPRRAPFGLRLEPGSINKRSNELHDGLMTRHRLFPKLG